ncbi:MAG: hypothetical protein K6T73_04900 [Candidatus Bathyarchaeota archaeon]|nr:hypothetical protein [Candidatus Bathyarchaeota archaeon]
MENYKKPKWWKRSVKSYWFLCVLLPFVAVLTVYGVLVSLELYEMIRVITYLVVTSVAIAAAYYIRTNPSHGLWRILWILFGVGIIGFPLSIALSFLLVNTISPIAGRLHLVLLSMLIAILVGGFLGDRLGKKRGYRPLW